MSTRVSGQLSLPARQCGTFVFQAERYRGLPGQGANSTGPFARRPNSPGLILFRTDSTGLFSVLEAEMGAGADLARSGSKSTLSKIMFIGLFQIFLNVFA